MKEKVQPMEMYVKLKLKWRNQWKEKLPSDIQAIAYFGESLHTVLAFLESFKYKFAFIRDVERKRNV